MVAAAPEPPDDAVVAAPAAGVGPVVPRRRMPPVEGLGGFG